MVHYAVVTPDQMSDVLISNLHPYASYEVTVIAVTVANGTENSKIFNTLPISKLYFHTNIVILTVYNIECKTIRTRTLVLLETE